MRPGSATVLSLLAATIAGVAMWLSFASFDVAGTSASPLRVAMLPSAPVLLGLIVMMLLLAAGAAVAVRPRPQEIAAAFWDPARDPLLPLLSAALLILPFLPFLADWMPALRVLAGESRWLLWVVVAGQVVWILVERYGVVSGTWFGVAALFLSAPLVFNFRGIAAAPVDLWNTLRGLGSASISRMAPNTLALLFDQEYGLITYAPVLLLGFAGVAAMLRDRSTRAAGGILCAAIVALLVLPATVNPWWSRSMLPGRPVLLVIPLLAGAAGFLYSRLRPSSAARAVAQVLLLLSAAITVVAVSGRLSLRQEGDGIGSLLQWASPTWPLWLTLPSFLEAGLTGAVWRVAGWCAVIAAISLAFARDARSTVGAAALKVTVTAVVLLLSVASMIARLTADPSHHFGIETRATFPMLETFDPIARPVAVTYGRFSLVPPEAIPPLFAVDIQPGQRIDRQPVRVLLNARFRLPPGEYVLGLKGSAQTAATVPVGLQIGREGRPVETWPIALHSGELSEHRFEVPLESEFVGFRGPRNAEQAIAALRLTPASVVGVRQRYTAPTILSAAAYEPATLFFHDSSVYPEASGFWVAGRTTAKITMKKTDVNRQTVTLAIHSGARPNVVTLSAGAWTQKLDLVPGVTQRVSMPVLEGERFVQLSITCNSGFVPAEIESTSDKRVLGAWIAFIPDDISRTSATP